MNFNRVYAVMLRHLFQFRRNFDKFIDVFFFSILELVIWGMTSRYFEHAIDQSSNSNGSYYVITTLSAILFWSLVTRISNDVPTGLLDDLWSRNLINLFGAPLTIGEWLLGSVLTGFIKALAALFIASIGAVLLYEFNILQFGLKLLPFMFLLLITGMWMGFFVSALIVRFGNRIQAFAWSFSWMLAPFSAIYYPVAILPHWAQVISWFLPTSYLFEAARSLVATGQLNWSLLLISLALGLFYLALTLVFIQHAFQKRMEMGILKLQ